MYYASHRLYISKNSPLGLHVVKVEQGRVIALFLFERELQSMLWFDTLLLSENNSLDGSEGTFDYIIDVATPSAEGQFLYVVEKKGDSYSLHLIS